MRDLDFELPAGRSRQNGRRQIANPLSGQPQGSALLPGSHNETSRQFFPVFVSITSSLSQQKNVNHWIYRVCAMAGFMPYFRACLRALIVKPTQQRWYPNLQTSAPVHVPCCFVQFQSAFNRARRMGSCVTSARGGFSSTQISIHRCTQA